MTPAELKAGIDQGIQSIRSRYDGAPPRVELLLAAADDKIALLGWAMDELVKMLEAAPPHTHATECPTDYSSEKPK
jgi:hypothetical protein